MAIEKSSFKKSLPVLFGNGFEAYDFVLYGMLASTFSGVFFPKTLDKNVSLTLSFLLFFCAYLTRPLGAIIWGYIGDKYGRKKVLTSTVMIMAIAAIGMIFIPTYEQIGVISPLILILLRIAQGIAFSGEFPTTMISLYEISPVQKKGFFCSLTETIGTTAILLGNSICLVLLLMLTKEEFDSFGWRIPFVFSILFIFIVYYIRKHFQETLELDISKKIKIPIFVDFKNNIKSIFKISLFISTNSFLLFSFLFYTNFVIQNLNKGSNEQYILPWIVQFLCVGFLVILYPIFGFLSDKIGIKKISNIGHMSILIFYFPVYYFLILSDYLTMNIIGIIIISMMLSMLATSYIPIMINMSNQLCRISVVSLGWGMSVIIFGASAPMISNIFIKLFEFESSPALYLMLLASISLFISFKYNKNLKFLSK